VNVYLDSSVILRVVLGQRNSLQESDQIELGVCSSLVETECLRTLGRMRLRLGLADKEMANRRETVYRLLEAVELVDVNRAVLSRAACRCRPSWELSTRFIWRLHCSRARARIPTWFWQLTIAR